MGPGRSFFTKKPFLIAVLSEILVIFTRYIKYMCMNAGARSRIRTITLIGLNN